MNVYLGSDVEKRRFSFEVDTFGLTRRGIISLIESIDGVRVTRKDGGWGGPHVFCEFDRNGVPFMVVEPFGDNSRYLVRTSDIDGAAEMLRVRDAFLAAPHRWWTNPVCVYGVGLVGAGVLLFRVGLYAYGALAGVTGCVLAAVSLYVVLKRRGQSAVIEEDD